MADNDDDEDDTPGATGGDTDSDAGSDGPTDITSQESMLGLNESPGDSPVPSEAADVVPPGGPPPDQGIPQAPPVQPDTPVTAGQTPIGQQLQAAAPTVQVNVTAPGQGAPGKQSQSQATSQSVSHRGENFDTLAKLDKNALPQEQALQGDLSYAAQAYKEQTEQAERDAKAVAEAERRRALAVHDQFQAQADGQAVIAKETAAWAEQEQIAQDHAANTTRAYRAKLDADTARVAAMKLNPRPQEGWSSGVQAGMAMSAFAQGFLAPKGIHIDSVGAINRVVDQQIRAQEEAIQRGEWLVGEDRELWQMARAEASDQAEARTRLRALKLSGMQADIQAHVAQVGGDLAKADGAVTIAKIQAALDDTKTSLTTTFYNRAVDIGKTLLSAKLERQKIAVEEARIASAERIAKMQADARGAGKQGLPVVSPIAGDVDKDGNPAIMGQYRPGVTADQVTRTNKRIQGAAKLVKAQENYEKASAELDGDKRVIGGRVTRLDSDAEARLKVAYEQLINAEVEAINPGEKPSEIMLDRFRKMIPLPTETGASMGDSIRAARLATSTGINDAQIEVSQYAVGFDGKPIRLGYEGVGGSDLAESNLTAFPDPARPGSLGLYIHDLASPTDPNGKPDPRAISALGGVYQVAIDPKNKNQARALDILKNLADSNVDDVSPYLQMSAEAFLLTPQLAQTLTPEDRAHYERGYKLDEKRTARAAEDDRITSTTYRENKPEDYGEPSEALQKEIEKSAPSE